MKLAYYPGCTLKTRAKNLEDSAVAALGALGVDFVELDRWNCCGAVYSLAGDDLIHHVAPVRNLVRVKEQGCDTVFTLCSQCYNTLARANHLVNEDEEAKKTLNTFMDEEPDYEGDVKVLHFLELLRDVVGWDEVASKVVKPLKGLKVAPFYGCTLIRPPEVAITSSNTPTILAEFLTALGCEPVDYPEVTGCCGSFQALGNPDVSMERSAAVLESALGRGAEAMVVSCPLCDYNLGKKQDAIIAKHDGLSGIPVYYFTQLLAVALGLEEETCHFELNHPASDGKVLTAAAVRQ